MRRRLNAVARRIHEIQTKNKNAGKNENRQLKNVENQIQNRLRRKSEIQQRIKKANRPGLFARLRRAPRVVVSNNNRAQIAKLNAEIKELQNEAARLFQKAGAVRNNTRRATANELRKLQNEFHNLERKLTPTEAYARLEAARKQYEAHGGGVTLRTHMFGRN